MTTPFDEGETILRALRALPSRDVPAGRADQIRERGAAALARRLGRRGPGPAAPAHSWRHVLEPAMVAGISAVYLVEVIRRALLLQGF